MRALFVQLSARRSSGLSALVVARQARELPTGLSLRSVAATGAPEPTFGVLDGEEDRAARATAVEAGCGARKRARDADETLGEADVGCSDSGSSCRSDFVPSASEDDLEKALEALGESSAVSPRAPNEEAAGAKQKDDGES